MNPNADLHDLRRMATHKSPGKKVVVFGDDHEPFVLGEVPDSLIVVAGKPKIPDVPAAGKQWKQNFNEPEREVQVEQRLHATVPRSRRSRSAANAKQARMSSAFRSGKSARISASVMPEAKYSSTSDTVMRMPRIHGFPLHFPGSTVIRS